MIGLGQILNKCSDGITAGCTIAWLHVGYVIHYKENIQKLQDEIKKLENELTRIDGSVEREKNDGKIPEADVLQWIESANGIKGDVEAFLAVDGARENKWCFKWCPNVYRHYKLGKGSEEKIARAISIKVEGEKYTTLEVAHPKPPLKFGYNFSQGYEAFDSRAEIFENIMKALADPCLKIIILCGPGGVGKTTMAKEVGKLAMQNRLFDGVGMAAISQTLNEKAVKEKLALQFGLKLDGSAHQLYHRLNNEKRNLVILDDVWKPLNLADIEIPITDGNKGCKVVITSRKRGLCQKMSVPVDQGDYLNAVLAEPEALTKEFLMEVLREREAWTLFKKVAAISVDFEIPSEAKEVCDKCGGLPVAISAVAAALKGKGEKHFWKDALQQLKNYQIKEIADIEQNLLISLNWSYDRLEHKDAKSCFLLCSLFPEDAEISIDDLVRYSIGMRLLDQNQPNIFDRVRDRVLAMVHVLKTSCLLLDGTRGNVVQMHDIVRDVAISIAKDEKGYMVKHGIETWPEKYDLYLAMSLRFITNIHKFPNELECERLHTLVLKCSNDSPTYFPNNFFNGMENNLEVLDLSEMRIRSCPSSLSTLVKLRMLCLNGGTDEALLGILGSIRNLEILSLTNIRNALDYYDYDDGTENALDYYDDGTEFSELQFPTSQLQIPPGSCCNLCELRVKNCQFEFLFTHSIARGLEQLQRLEIEGCEAMEEIIRNERQGDEEEIIFHHLKKMVLRDLPNLRSFYSSMENTSTTEANNSNPSRPLFCEKVPFPALEEYHLKKLVLQDLPNLSFYSSMKNTSTTEANNSNPSRPLFCEKVAFPALEELIIYGVENISGIIGDKQLKLPVQQKENESFWNLPRLQDLRIGHCSNLKAIVVANKKRGAPDKPLIFCELCSLHLESLENLKSFYSICGSTANEGISKPQPLFNEKVVFPCLKELKIEFMDNFEQIWISTPPTNSLNKITRLYVSWCDKLLYVAPSELLGSLQNLQSLEIEYCNSIEEVFKTRGSNAGEGIVSRDEATSEQVEMLPQLERVSLEELPGLISFCSGYKLPRSVQLSIKDCPSFRPLM